MDHEWKVTARSSNLVDWVCDGCGATICIIPDKVPNPKWYVEKRRVPAMAKTEDNACSNAVAREVHGS